MNYAALSLEQTPPLSVPLRFFLTAPLFVVAAGLFLIVYGQDALLNRWTPWTLALTHLMTLGFLALVMVGAVQQLLPVLMGASVSRPGLTSGVLHGLLTLGTVALVSGLASGSAPAMVTAAILLGGGFGLFITVAGWGLWRARSGHFTRTAMMLSLLALTVAVAFGVNQSAGYAGALPLFREYTDVHLGLGLLGWVGLLIIGVAYQVVPMFQITPDYPRWLMRGLTPVLFLALIGWALAHSVPAWSAWTGTLFGAVLAIGFSGFAVTTLWLQHQRRRRLPDVTLDFWRVAMASLLAAVLVWVWGRVSGAVPELLLGVLFVMGFAQSAVNGMLYKIGPFLVWLHLNNRRQTEGRPQTGIPNMKQIIPERSMRYQFRLQVGALAAVIAALALPVLARPAGILVTLSALLLAGNLSLAYKTYRTHA